MGWYLESVRIFVTNFSGSGKQIIARLQPLAGGTINQVFGYETETKKLKGFIVGEDDLNSIKYMVISGATPTLTGNGIGYGDYYISSFSWNRLNVIAQTLTSDCDAPVFEFDMELYAY